MMWGGGDGSSDVRGTAGQAGDTGAIGAAGAAGPAGAGLSEDGQIYGPQPGETDAPPPRTFEGRESGDGQGAGPGTFGQEEVMEDQWAEENPESGWFEGNEGADGGGGWGDWGGGGDWL